MTAPPACTYGSPPAHNCPNHTSPGTATGTNGLAIDDPPPTAPPAVPSHYRQSLRGAGRVMHGHDGSPLPA